MEYNKKYEIREKRIYILNECKDIINKYDLRFGDMDNSVAQIKEEFKRNDNRGIDLKLDDPSTSINICLDYSKKFLYMAVNEYVVAILELGMLEKRIKSASEYISNRLIEKRLTHIGGHIVNAEKYVKMSKKLEERHYKHIEDILED